MANCPNCGSDHIQLKQDTDVNWGRAVAGWAMFGIVGGAVGAVTGEDKNVNACLNCGSTWKAKDLYNILQTIKNSTGANLDLAKETDRYYLNSFITDLSFYLKRIATKRKEGEKLISKVRKDRSKGVANGCVFGLMISMIGCGTLAASGVGMLMIFVFPIMGAVIGNSIDSIEKKAQEKAEAKVQARVNLMNKEAEETFRKQVKVFMQNYSLK